MAYINLTLPNGEVPHDNMLITFVAPCNCDATDGLKIGTICFAFADSNGEVITGTGGYFSKGDLVTVTLKMPSNIACIQEDGRGEGVGPSITVTKVGTTTTITVKDSNGVTTTTIEDGIARFG